MSLIKIKNRRPIRATAAILAPIIATMLGGSGQSEEEKNKNFRMYN